MPLNNPEVQRLVGFYVSLSEYYSMLSDDVSLMLYFSDNQRCTIVETRQEL